MPFLFVYYFFWRVAREGLDGSGDSRPAAALWGRGRELPSGFSCSPAFSSFAGLVVAVVAEIRFFFRSSPAMGVGRSARSRELLVGAPKWCTWTLGYLLDVSGPLLLSQNPGLGPKGKALSFLGPKNALSLPCCLCHFCFSVCLFYRFPSDNVCFFIYIERKKKTRCTTAEFECVQRTHVMTEIFEISG